jgi:hypothetical protein
MSTNYHNIPASKSSKNEDVDGFAFNSLDDNE